MTGPQKNKWWVPGIEFTGHVFVATVIFGLIAVAAFGLDFLVRTLKTTSVEPWMIKTLSVVESGLFIVDVATYGIYVLSSTIRFVVAMLKGGIAP